jgi:hypothetical protein
MFVSVRRKICEKSGAAILSGRTLCFSIEARFRVRGRFLPHIMAADPWRPHQGQKGKKGHATLCGRTICTLVLCLQRLRRDSRHIIWRESATRYKTNHTTLFHRRLCLKKAAQESSSHLLVHQLSFETGACCAAVAYTSEVVMPGVRGFF